MMTENTATKGRVRTHRISGGNGRWGNRRCGGARISGKPCGRGFNDRRWFAARDPGGRLGGGW